MEGDMPKEKGSSRATAMEGEMPGIAPARIPTMTPARITTRGVNPMRRESPSYRWLRVSITAFSYPKRIPEGSPRVRSFEKTSQEKRSQPPVRER